MNTQSIEYKKEKTSRCAIYACISTDECNENNFASIEHQVSSCKLFIAAHKHKGWELVTQEVDVASGKTLNRPGLQRLLAKAEAKEFDRIIIYKIDKLSRRISDFHGIWRRLSRSGVDITCSTQAIDTSDGAGLLMLNILLSFAHFEREINAQRVRDKREQSLNSGFWQGGLIPFGYQQKHSKKFDRKILIPILKEADVVRKIYNLFLKQKCQRGVVKQINAGGYKTKLRYQKNKGGQSRLVGGKNFDEVAITQILRNRIYIGELWDERNRVSYDARHEPIILDKGIWFKVQEILETNNKTEGETYGNRKE